jgi:nucleotide-binding universal stress UspA family protein
MSEPLSKIILCFDNSEISFLASSAALDLAKAFSAEVVGVHGYNAFMHEGAFRIMEPTLPAEFQKEEILQKQRKAHSTLINMGMEKISLSYLRPLEEFFGEAKVSYRTRVKEGKNYEAVNAVLREEGGDLVVMGSSGFNSNGSGFIGSVCLRILRGNDRDFLIVKKTSGTKEKKFVVCLDGSSSAIGDLTIAKSFAEKFQAELHLIYVFDSALHKDVFGRLKESVISSEGFSFNSKEQERIHDEFIDKGLARVGNMILDKAEQEVFGAVTATPALTDGWGLAGGGDAIPRIKKVLEGHIYKRICDYAAEISAEMIFVGRNGRHFARGMDIGSVAENVVRFAPCNVFVARSEAYKGWEL